MVDAFRQSGRVRGRQGRGQRARNVNPRVRKLEGSRGRLAAGAIRPPAAAFKSNVAHIWPMPPATWAHSLGEWIVYWYLRYRKRFIEGRDFYFQSRLFAPTLFLARDYTEADFFIDMGPTSPIGQIAQYRGLVLDPFDEFTHSFAFDLRRRAELESNGYLLVYIANPQLELETEYVMEQALRGKDLSNRGYFR